MPKPLVFRVVLRTERILNAKVLADSEQDAGKKAMSWVNVFAEMPLSEDIVQVLKVEAIQKREHLGGFNKVPFVNPEKLYNRDMRHNYFVEKYPTKK